ncbi:Beta-1,4-N-acetylgalactosaminyltransferase bre-4 [Papilio xuthus]|uniref:Beta-1,4-N-acetylgalactosaminyltransferase n=1 Tax=Papilio xuthus TaxID=66420 RepID=A0A194QAT2_PAPXU|nr:Beta-1,4-N-acetylgalactosaminyltransferase bre-4 [Papilio xuthus]
MPKWFPINKLLQIRVSSCIVFLLCLVAAIQFFASYGRYHYEHIPREQLLTNIFFKTNPKLEINKEKPKCNYDGILQSTSSIDTQEVPRKFGDFTTNGLANGSYTPENCNPLLSVAILVSYRNRQSQLDIFIPYMHNFLRKQGIHYTIYIIEQQDDKPWNKGLLYNIGAKQAIADRFPCLILHDIDLLPLDIGNLYSCLQEPRHMSASIDKFRFVLTYDYLVGGALAIRSDQYIAVNGFSNKFEGWGGEDDDFAGRMKAKNLKVLRYPRELSRYTMLAHPQEQKNSERSRILSENQMNYSKDGLGNAEYSVKSVHRNTLFTLIGVKT